MLGDVGVTSWVFLGSLVFLSAFFSGSEAALLSVQRVRIQHMVAARVAGASRVARMIERPDKLLPPILLGNNLVNTAVAALSTAIALDLIANENRAVLSATVVATVVLLIFGETLPKTFAARHPERFSIVAAWPMHWIGVVLLPGSFLLQKLSSAVARLFGGAQLSRHYVTEEEIKTMISMGREAGTVEHGEAEMIRRVLEFGDRRVREIMTPRPEIVGVEASIPIKEFLGIYSEHYHTRFPVYEESLDNVVGVISVKDVVRALATGASGDDSATSAMRPAYFVPETKRVTEMLNEMRAAGHQLAMIADEFGGIAGLVTIKRLVEGIVGPVGDEDEDVEDEVVEITENTFEVDAGLSIIDANERLGLALPTGEYETVAGFILERLGRIPAVDDQLAFGSLTLMVSEMRGARILRVRVTRQESASIGQDEQA